MTPIEHVRAAKARYCRYVDTKQWDKLSSLFTDDCRFEGLVVLSVFE